MKSKIVYILLMLLVAAPAFAEKIPVKIAPAQVISTGHDEIEVGDWIEFETVNDVYKEDSLFLKKNSRIVGVVDFVHSNGWGGDGAEIKFKTFYVADINGKKNTIESPLVLNGSNLNGNTNKFKSIFSNGANNLYLVNSLAIIAKPLVFIRGSEIFIEPDTVTFNLFITQ